MSNIFLALFGICLGVSFTANAQIDLGIDDLDSVSDKLDAEATTSNTQSETSKSFSFFGNAFNWFETSKSSSSENEQLSIEELEKKAADGDIETQLELGYTYLYGLHNTEVDYKKALHYYTLAGQQKNAVALNNLGSLYFSGIGTDVDYPKAISFFDEAAQLGSDDAAVNLAIIYLGSDTTYKSQQDLDKILELLIKAEPRNNIAKYLLGYSYLHGFLVPKDYNKAFKLIKTAADAEYDEALLVLSDFYIQGWGTPKNYNKAVKSLKNAASQGNATAMVKLGDILAEGKIYKRSITDAHVQYNIASVLGVKEAGQKRDELEKNIKIEDLLTIQSEADDYEAKPSDQTTFIRQTYGDSLKVYIDLNLKKKNKSK